MKSFFRRKQSLFLFILLLLIHESSVFAQATAFRLSDYKYRTTGFRALSFAGYSSGTASTGQSKATGFSLIPSIAYRQQFSTEKQQFFLQGTASLAADFSNGTDIEIIGGPSMKRNNSNLGGSAGLSFSNRLFKKNLFMEYGADASLGYASRSNKQTLTGKTTKGEYTVTAMPFVGVGRGRLENVSDAQMALFILDDLKKAGKLKNNLTPALTEAFATLVTQVYNRRIFDFRKRRIYELEKLDSFFKANNLLTSHDIHTYNIIQDNWAFSIQPSAVDAIYANSGTLTIANSTDGLSDRVNKDGMFGQYTRFSGRQMYVRLMPFLSNIGNNEKTDTTGKEINRTASVGAAVVVGFDEQQPISIKLQWNKFASLRFEYGTTSQEMTGPGAGDNIKLRSNASAVSLYGGVGVGYYPNSRTVVQAFGTMGLSKRLAIAEGSAKQPLIVSPSVVVNGSYFLSYTSRISGNVTLGYTSGAQGYGGRFNCSYNIRFIQYIF